MNELQALEARGRMGNKFANRIAMVGRETGNRGLGKQQGTTRVIYDTIDMYNGSAAGVTSFDFFGTLNNKAYPFTNINRNSFTDAEAMSVARAYLTYIYCDNGSVSYTTTSQFSLVCGLDEASTFLGSIVGISKTYFSAAGKVAGLQLAEGSLLISGQEVLKKFNFLSANGVFNHKSNILNSTQNYSVGGSTATAPAGTTSTGFATNRGSQVYTFDSAAVIPPNREFHFPINVGSYTLPTGVTALNYGQHYLRLTLEGFGAIPSVEGTL
jgi:hypothetical protein